MPGSEDDADQVGYGRPPKASQFKKGTSGNPKGRPKASAPSPAAQTTLDRVMNRKVNMAVNGKIKKVSLREAIAAQYVGAGTKGNLGVQKELLRLIHATELSRGSVPEKRPAQEVPISKDDASQHFAEVLVTIGVFEALCYHLSIAFQDENGRIYIHPEVLEWALARNNLKRADIPKSIPYQVAKPELIEQGVTSEDRSITPRLLQFLTSMIGDGASSI